MLRADKNNLVFESHLSSFLPFLLPFFSFEKLFLLFGRVMKIEKRCPAFRPFTSEGLKRGRDCNACVSSL